jgi:hypothetical protein
MASFRPAVCAAALVFATAAPAWAQSPTITRGQGGPGTAAATGSVSGRSGTGKTPLEQSLGVMGRERLLLSRGQRPSRPSYRAASQSADSQGAVGNAGGAWYRSVRPVRDR